MSWKEAQVSEALADEADVNSPDAALAKQKPNHSGQVPPANPQRMTSKGSSNQTLNMAKSGKCCIGMSTSLMTAPLSGNPRCTSPRFVTQASIVGGITLSQANR
jgi:hypothetical protein